MQVPGAVFSCVRPTPWTTPPALVAHSQEALALLDLDPAVTETTAFADWVAGNLVLEGSVPMAHRCGVCQCRQASQPPFTLYLDTEVISSVTGRTSLETAGLTYSVSG